MISCRGVALGLVCINAIVCCDAGAETVTWTNGTADGLWQNASNWNPPRIPDLNDDVVIPDGRGTVTLTGSCRAGTIQADGPVLLTSQLEVNGSSEFRSHVEIEGELTGNGDITLTGQATWRDGTIQGGGLLLVAPTSELTIESAGEPVLSRTLENFGLIQVVDQRLRIQRPSGLLRVPDGGTIVFRNAAGVVADMIDSEAMVITGTCRSEGPGETTFEALVLNVGRMETTNTVIFDPPPTNLSQDGVFSDGEWVAAEDGILTWPADVSVKEIGEFARFSFGGNQVSPKMTSELEAIRGSLSLDVLTPVISVAPNGLMATVFSGRLSVAGGSRINFARGLVLEAGSTTLLEPSQAQPGITALTQLVTPITLGGTLIVNEPTQNPLACGEAVALITGVGTFTPIEGSFSQVITPLVPRSIRYSTPLIIGNAVFAIALVAESRADWNLDGGVDGDDIIAFFASWDVNEGDFNGDGASDGDDVIEFFTSWDRGC